MASLAAVGFQVSLVQQYPALIQSNNSTVEICFVTANDVKIIQKRLQYCSNIEFILIVVFIWTVLKGM